jgi:hypothetical protein
MIDFKPNRRHSDSAMTTEQVGILSFVAGMLFIMAIHVFISGV